MQERKFCWRLYTANLNSLRFLLWPWSEHLINKRANVLSPGIQQIVCVHLHFHATKCKICWWRGSCIASSVGWVKFLRTWKSWLWIYLIFLTLVVYSFTEQLLNFFQLRISCTEKLRNILSCSWWLCAKKKEPFLGSMSYKAMFNDG